MNEELHSDIKVSFDAIQYGGNSRSLRILIPKSKWWLSSEDDGYYYLQAPFTLGQADSYLPEALSNNSNFGRPTSDDAIRKSGDGDK